MGKRIAVGLLRLSLIAVFVAIAGREANAAVCSTKYTTGAYCKSSYSIGGLPVCTLWCTGSEICDNLVTGVPSSLLKACESAPETCPTITCSVFGTLGSAECADPTVPGSPGQECAIEGVAICWNPQEKYNAAGTAFNLPGYLTGVAENAFCTKGGKCTGYAELDPDPGTMEICNNNWTFQTFTAKVFKGETCLCLGGVDSSGTCCATADRTDGKCTVPADLSEYCVQQYCKANLASYELGKNILYDCVPIVPVP